MNRYFFVAVTYFLLYMPAANAGLLVGTGTGNDDEADVLAIVNTYNSANDPDLPTDFDLFKKTDDDAAFVFDMANGFMFFSDAGGTMPVATEDDLTGLSTAYFKYTGPETLLYYSSKAGQNVNVYTVMAGLNLINVSNQDISHMSFWSGELPPPGEGVPEPAAFVSASIAGAVFACRRARR